MDGSPGIVARSEYSPPLRRSASDQMSPSREGVLGVGVAPRSRRPPRARRRAARRTSRRSRRTRAGAGATGSAGRGRGCRASRPPGCPASPGSSNSPRATTEPGATGPPTYTSSSAPGSAASAGTASATQRLGAAVEHHPHRSVLAVLEHEDHACAGSSRTATARRSEAVPGGSVHTTIVPQSARPRATDG